LARFLDISLVDVSDKLTPLARKPGLHNWKVMIEVGNPIEKSESDEIQIGEKKLSKTLWPNGRESELHLERW
jgi:hypothetical protein